MVSGAGVGVPRQQRIGGSISGCVDMRCMPIEWNSILRLQHHAKRIGRDQGEKRETDQDAGITGYSISPKSAPRQNLLVFSAASRGFPVG